MSLMTISEVTKSFNISTRMLRHYEKIGLLQSQRKEDYAYRVYDENSVRRLQYIIVFRKLRIPLKQIALILKSPEQVKIMEILHENIHEVNEELSALEIIRDSLEFILSHLKNNQKARIKLEMLQDADLMRVIEPLTLSKINFKEARSMEDLNKANKELVKLRNVRIVVLPPCTVASYHFIGENPEETVGGVMDKFIKESGLYLKKPDARMFGFNHPNPSTDKEHYGYEDWVTIPEDMEVPAPLVKKRFEGGMYAAHTISFPDFHEWQLLSKWAEENDKYAPNYSEKGEEIMGGCLEEHLNWVYSSHMGWPENGIDGHLDLLLPIKFK
jgi:DNA-binding transcriptional MerR regulator/DNA gyrase inhibitor GyrI